MRNEVIEDEAVEDQPAEKIQPAFPQGMVVQSVALVVDRNGVAWWVHPDSRTIYKAAAL